MTLPNLFSVSRIALTPVLMLLLLGPPEGTFAAAILLILAGATDSFDGYLARRFKQVSTFGVFLDLTADKIIVSAVMVALVQLQLIPAWVAAVIIGREFIIMGLRISAASAGLIIPAQGWGKSKTVVTLIALTFVILKQDFMAGGPMARLNAFGAVDFLLSRFTWPLVLLAVMLTIVSGLTYILGALSAFPEKGSGREAAGSGPRPAERTSKASHLRRMTTFGASSVHRLFRKMREVW